MKKKNLLESIICMETFIVFSGLGMFWSNVEIMEYFRAKDKRNSQLFKKPERVHIQIDSDTRSQADLFDAYLSSDDPLQDYLLGSNQSW